MPHVEIKYSDNLKIDTLKVFDAIEKVINKNDNNAGECKSRAYPCSQYKYSHIIVIVSLLTKPHRDEAFTQKLSDEIETVIKSYLNQSSYLSLSIEYSKPYYTTNIHLIEGDELEKINQESGC